MSILIKGMEMPTTGLYFVSVDNSNGRDKTVIAVERMLGNRDVRQIVGSFELVEIPPHGRLVDADALMERLGDVEYKGAIKRVLIQSPTVIPAEEGET